MPGPAPAGTAAPMAAGVTTPPIVDAAFGSLWPERSRPAGRASLLAARGIGVSARLSIPCVNAGRGTTLMLLASGLLVLWVSRYRRRPFTWACAALAAGFAPLFVMRDADWILVLGLLTSAL